MADAYIYDQDCDDFTTIGLCGRLHESVCTFEEEANGMSELTLEHPIDPERRFDLLRPGRIIKAMVPVRNIPELDGDTQEYVKSVQKWYVRKDASKLERTVFNKRDDQIEAERAEAQAANRAAQEDRRRRREAGEDVSDESESDIDIDKIKKKKLKVLKKGAKVTITRNWGDLYPEVRVKIGKVTGYIMLAALDDKTVETHTFTTVKKKDTIFSFYEDMDRSWTAKEQLFRIYSARREGEKVVVQARHIFYDNAHTLTVYNSNASVSLATVLKGIKKHRIGSCETVFVTNIKGSRSGAHYENKNLVEALLDPEEGIAARWGGDVIRDNFECTLIDEAGFDRGVCLDYGHDLLGVEYTVNWDNVITAVRPIGKTADGKNLYIKGYKGLVESSRAKLYPHRRVAVLEVSEAQVKKGELTTPEARVKLKAAAKELLASGADRPEVSVHVTFQQLGETVEYAAYKGLKDLFLFDLVRVRNPRIGVDVKARVTRVVWNCRLQRMEEVELGTLRDLSPKVPGYQLSGGINGGKIAPGTITSAELDDESINVRHMQADSVNAQAIQALAVTAEKIAADAINATHIQAGSVTADKLEAGVITAGMLSAFNAVIHQIDAGHVAADTLDAAVATLGVLTAGSAGFDRATVRHLVSEAMHLEFGAMGEVFIRNLSVAYAQMIGAAIGNLCVKARDGNYYSIDVGADGTVTATPATVTESEIVAGQTETGRNILETSILAESLSTSNLLATYALVNQLDAARIDVDQLFAREAFINKLRTSEIIGGKSLTIIAGEVDEAKELANGAVAGTVIQYASGVSPNAPPASGWSTTPPEHEQGRYIWQKTVTTYVNGTSRQSTPVNISGADGEPATVLRIDSSRGTVFKNNLVSTTLSAVIYRGPERVTDMEGLRRVFGAGAYLQWSWQRLDEDRFGVISADDSRIGDGGFSFTLSPEDVDTKVTFMCELIVE